MKKLILLITISVFLMGCYINFSHSQHASGKGRMSRTEIYTTIGQELMNLK